MHFVTLISSGVKKRAANRSDVEKKTTPVLTHTFPTLIGCGRASLAVKHDDRGVM